MESMDKRTEQEAASPRSLTAAPVSGMRERIRTPSEGWPRWRLRLGTALVLFSGFEAWVAGEPGGVRPR